MEPNYKNQNEIQLINEDRSS